MNREIKFRVWSSDERKWVDFPNRGFSSFEPIIPKIYTDNNYFVIQQYTGLKDKNNIEIYEGDIIYWGALNYLVEWNDRSCKWQGRCPYYHKYHHPVTEQFRELMNGAIAGNIFQHSQLLKQHES